MNASQLRDPAPTGSAPVVGGKPPYYNILNAAEAFGWRDGLTSNGWNVLELLLKRQSRIGWDRPVSMAVSSIAERLNLSNRQVWRIRASLADKGAITVHAGHGAMPGKRAQAAWYVIHSKALRRPYGEVNPSSVYEAAKADAARRDTGHVTARVTGHVTGSATESGGLMAYLPTQPTLLSEASERADISATSERNEEVTEKMVHREDLPPAPRGDTNDHAVGDTQQLVDYIAAMDGVVLPRRELSALPTTFTDAVRACRDGGMAWDAICELVEEAVSKRTGKVVGTLSYFRTWLATAAAEIAAVEESKVAERHYQRKIADEQRARTADRERVTSETVEPPEDDEVLRRLMPGLSAMDLDISLAETAGGEVATDGDVPDGHVLSADEIGELRTAGAEIPAVVVADEGQVTVGGSGQRKTALCADELEELRAVGADIPGTVMAESGRPGRERSHAHHPRSFVRRLAQLPRWVIGRYW